MFINSGSEIPQESILLFTRHSNSAQRRISAQWARIMLLAASDYLVFVFEMYTIAQCSGERVALTVVLLQRRKWRACEIVYTSDSSKLCPVLYSASRCRPVRGADSIASGNSRR